jgi:hypothetical protein
MYFTTLAGTYLSGSIYGYNSWINFNKASSVLLAATIEGKPREVLFIYSDIWEQLGLPEFP